MYAKKVQGTKKLGSAYELYNLASSRRFKRSLLDATLPNVTLWVVDVMKIMSVVYSGKDNTQSLVKEDYLKCHVTAMSLEPIRIEKEPL